MDSTSKGTDAVPPYAPLSDMGLGNLSAAERAQICWSLPHNLGELLFNCRDETIQPNSPGR